MRKTPVEAIQWTGENWTELGEFMRKSTKDYRYIEYLYGDILLCYWDFNARKHMAKIPKFGWVVREGNTCQFYKDATFRKTFEAVADDCKAIDWKSVKAITEAFCGFGVEPSKKASGVLSTIVRLNNKGLMANLIYDFYKGGEKTREEIKKNMSEGLKEMAGSDTHKATFESVLDEMKELHAKKNACYGDAAHVNFLKYGPVASLSRLSEKMQRAEHILLSGKCEVKDEPLTETLIDMAITSAMLYLELKNKNNG